MQKATAKNLKRGKKRVVGRRRTMRGGFANVKDACAQIAVAPDLEAKKKIFRKASLRYHPDKGGTAEEFAELQNCYERAIAPPPKPAPKPAAQPAAQPAAEPPNVQVGLLTPETWGLANPEAQQAIHDFVRSFPERFVREVLKITNLFVVSGGPGATYEEINDAMMERGLDEGQRAYMFALIQKTYNPQYPLQTVITVLTPL